MIFTDNFHTPVLLPKIIEVLEVKKDCFYIDATIGGGGYTKDILQKGGKVLGIDRDQEAIIFCQKKFRNNKNLILENGNFADLKKIVNNHKVKKIKGIIFDLGISSFQIDTSKRGFSYRKNETLDMRMSKSDKLNAFDVLNKYRPEKLYEIFSKYSEELHSGAIASVVSRSRSIRGTIRTTFQLRQLIDQALRKVYMERSESDYIKIREKTIARIFQAIRIEINDEIENLKKGLDESIDLLDKSGKLIVLSYHSIEDRQVKLFIKQKKKEKVIEITGNQPIRAVYNEVRKNPRARSAKLRIAEKL